MTTNQPFGPGQPDKDLILAAQAGDEAAFTALYGRYAQIAWRRAMKLLGDVSEVDDVLQDTFVQIHKSMHRVDPDRPFVKWLYRILRDACIDHLRRRPRVLDPPAIGQFSAPADQWDRLAARDKMRTLYAALENVNIEAREAFVLHTLEGQTLAEISELTGDSINTVAARVRRTRERLRTVLDPDRSARSQGGVS